MECSIPQEVPAHQMKPELLELAASPPVATIGLLLPMPLFLRMAYLMKRIKKISRDLWRKETAILT